MLDYKNEFATYTNANQTIKDVTVKAEQVREGLLFINGTKENALNDAKQRLENASLIQNNEFNICVYTRVVRQLSQQC